LSVSADKPILVSQPKEIDMLKILNPLWWLGLLGNVLHDVFGPLLRALGFMKSLPPTGPHDNTQPGDVFDAQNLAAAQHAAADTLDKAMSPAEVVQAYCRATEGDRKMMDLSALSDGQQDWLLGLSDVDYVLLGNESVSGCERSLEALQVFRFKRRAAAETASPIVLSTDTAEEMTDEQKQDFISARFLELFQAPGAANAEPRFRPILH
jgi:hypothetical protein